jgi:hypothetical protein
MFSSLADAQAYIASSSVTINGKKPSSGGSIVKFDAAKAGITCQTFSAVAGGISDVKQKDATAKCMTGSCL